MPDTIFALSSGAPPAAIAIVRISGPKASSALKAVCGRLPEARHATYAALHHPIGGELVDRGLVLWFPGPGSATGEDLAELHLHGGRSVVTGMLSVLSSIEGLREAEPGEFTRRAFENGRIDLAEAEGLADLLSAETEAQRRAALNLAGGALSRLVETWQERILGLSAAVEAGLDFSDEDDVGSAGPASWVPGLKVLTDEMEAMLARPPAERLKDGLRVVIAGPPNAGKSSLLNYLTGREAAIISPVAGTTRDVIEAPTAIGGSAFVLIDTAGLRESDDEIEGIGIQRARDNLAGADLILWLGYPQDAPDADRTIIVATKSDLISTEAQLAGADVSVSSKTGEGMDRLLTLLRERSAGLLPAESEVALNRRHRTILASCCDHLQAALSSSDPLVIGEELRLARRELDRLTGRAGVEDMLDALFSAFCIGK